MIVELQTDALLPEVTISDNGYYAETGIHARPIATTTLESIDEEIASLLALRGFIGSNGALVDLYHVRDKISNELFNRNYYSCHTDMKTAIDRIIKAEGLASVE